jgi:hypothetical protein
MSSKYLISLKKQGLENLLRSLPPFVKLDITTYIDTHNKAKFIDEVYGEFWALPINVGHKKSMHPKRGQARSLESRKKNALARAIRRLPSHVKIVEETYNGMNNKARFIDEKYGEFWAWAASVFNRNVNHPKRSNDQRMLTNLKRHGVEHAIQSKVFFDKSMQSMNRAVTKKHWKSEEALTCVASFENFVVDYLNLNRIDFLWQPVSFLMPDGCRSYRPDLYLKEKDLWIEIKGVFWGDAKNKWDWFHQQYPNSELWDEKVLKSMGFKYKKRKS